MITIRITPGLLLVILLAAFALMVREPTSQTEQEVEQSTTSPAQYDFNDRVNNRAASYIQAADTELKQNARSRAEVYRAS